jgi:hypothetical protein
MSDLESEPAHCALRETIASDRLPFFWRVWAALSDQYSEVTNDKKPEAQVTCDAESKPLADKLPFFLRLWSLRQHAGSEQFISYHGELTLPLGSQYSDPLCDASSADYQLY